MLVCAENTFKQFITQAVGKLFAEQGKAVNKIKISPYPTIKKEALVAYTQKHTHTHVSLWWSSNWLMKQVLFFKQHHGELF